jgi:hypothetical protein
MKKTLIVCCLIALSGIVFQGAQAQGKKKSAAKKPTEEEMMKRWEESMTPGDAHRKLGAFVGTWDVEAKIWMKSPKDEPNVSKGSAEYKMALGGRFLQQEFTGDMMGQPVNGVGYTGYDNFRKKYVSFWIDNTATSMSMMEGSMDKEGKTLTLWGKMDAPAMGKKDEKVKYVMRVVSPDKHVFEMYNVSERGEKDPMMVLTYTRK